MPSSRRRGQPACCPKCKEAFADQFAGHKETCSQCKHKLKYGDLVAKCKRCKNNLCTFCKTGEKRPQENSSSSKDDDDEPLVTITTGKTTGVPAKRKKESPRETQRREAVKVKQREKDRLLAAQTRGLPGIFDMQKDCPKSPTDCYSLVAQGLGFVAGGKQVPIILKPYEKKLLCFVSSRRFHSRTSFRATQVLPARPKGLGDGRCVPCQLQGKPK